MFNVSVNICCTRINRMLKKSTLEIWYERSGGVLGIKKARSVSSVLHVSTEGSRKPKKIHTTCSITNWCTIQICLVKRAFVMHPIINVVCILDTILITSSFHLCENKISHIKNCNLWNMPRITFSLSNYHQKQLRNTIVDIIWINKIFQKKFTKFGGGDGTSLHITQIEMMETSQIFYHMTNRLD